MSGQNILYDVAGGIAVDSLKARTLVADNLVEKAGSSAVYRLALQNTLAGSTGRMLGNLDPNLKMVASDVFGIMLGGLVVNYVTRGSMDAPGAAKQGFEMGLGSNVIRYAMNNYSQ